MPATRKLTLINQDCCTKGRNSQLESKKQANLLGDSNYQTKEFMLRGYEVINGASAIDFMKYLRSKFSGKKIVLTWDGATYYKSREIQEVLTSVNQGKELSKWEFSCIFIGAQLPCPKTRCRCVATGQESFEKFLASVHSVAMIFLYC